MGWEEGVRGSAGYPTICMEGEGGGGRGCGVDAARLGVHVCA